MMGRKYYIIFLSIAFILSFLMRDSYAEQANPDKKSAGSAKNEYQTLDDLFTLYQPYLKNIKVYEPIYFLVGTNPEKSKFQFSFRYQFFNASASIVEKYGWLQGVNFAYTQTSFWDLKSASQPFEDTSYKPEFFFLTENISQATGRLKGIFLQTGLQHESNGQIAGDSRTTNTFYVKPIFIYYNQDNLIGAQIAPKIWTYIDNDDHTNPDLDDYRGYFDLEIKFGKADRIVVASHFRPSREGNSLQLDLTYPIHQYFSNNTGVYFHMQYTNSLAENLLNYKDRTHALRLGISLIR